MSCRRLASLLAALVLSSIASVTAVASEPFDPSVPLLPSEVRLPRWEQALVSLRADRRRLETCLEDATACGHPRLMAWRNLVHSLGDAAPETVLAAVDAFVDAVPYARDRDTFGVNDHWAGPWRFLQSRGDCEDYAIAKYATLEQLGFARRDLQIVVVEDTWRGVAHAVLAVRLPTMIWILDNQFAAPTPAATLDRYRPYYAVNEDARWLHRLPDQSATSAR